MFFPRLLVADFEHWTSIKTEQLCSGHSSRLKAIFFVQFACKIRRTFAFTVTTIKHCGFLLYLQFPSLQQSLQDRWFQSSYEVNMPKVKISSFYRLGLGIQISTLFCDRCHSKEQIQSLQFQAVSLSLPLQQMPSGGLTSQSFGYSNSILQWSVLCSL